MQKLNNGLNRKPGRVDFDAMMDNAMKKIAQIHARQSEGQEDWVFHQAIRFLFDGYPHHAGPLFRKLLKLEGETKRVQGLRLILESEAIHPTPFANLCPKRVIYKTRNH